MSEGEKSKEVREQPKTEQPSSVKAEPVKSEKVNNIVYRLYDSDDVVRIRDAAIKTQIIGNEQKVIMNTGSLQKISLCVGVKKCPWFSDEINDNIGVTIDIFNKRANKEFRKVPVKEIDRMFKEVQEFNKADFDVEDLKKK